MDQENLHVLQRPPMFLNLVYRHWKTVTLAEDPDKSVYLLWFLTLTSQFRRELKEKLIELRVSNQKKDPNFVNQFHQRVLDGEELSRDEIDSWIYDAAEYFIFCGHEGTKEEIYDEVRNDGDFMDDDDFEDEDM